MIITESRTQAKRGSGLTVLLFFGKLVEFEGMDWVCDRPAEKPFENDVNGRSISVHPRASFVRFSTTFSITLKDGTKSTFSWRRQTISRHHGARAPPRCRLLFGRGLDIPVRNCQILGQRSMRQATSNTLSHVSPHFYPNACSAKGLNQNNPNDLLPCPFRNSRGALFLIVAAGADGRL